MRGRTLIIASLVGLTGLGVVAAAAGQPLRLGTASPEVAGEHWINSGPLTTAGLRGRVVLVEFWTYG